MAKLSEADIELQVRAINVKYIRNSTDEKLLELYEDILNEVTVRGLNHLKKQDADS